MDWLKCNICFNTYNDSCLRPRSLSCGHTFCEKCLDSTIQNKTLTCPQCRQILEINSVVDLPINFVLEGLLKSLNPSSQDVSEGAISTPVEGECLPDDKVGAYASLKSILEQQEKSLTTQKELLKTTAGMCNEHPSNELIFRCSSHKCWVCEKCIEKRGDHPKHNCRIKSFKEEIEERRKEHEISLDNEEKSYDETIFLIEKHISYLSEKREHHISLVEALQDLVNVHKREDNILLSEMTSFEKCIENGKIVKQSLLDVKTTVLKAETLDESITARDMVENKKVDVTEWVKKSEKEINEGKLKVQISTHLEMATKSSLEYREKFGLLHEELNANINQSEQNEVLENRINVKDIEVTEKNESRISEATNDDVCKAHRKAIGHRCLKCQRWLCDNCLKIHTTVIGCSTISSSTAVKNMKDEHTKSIDVLLSAFEEDINCWFSNIQKHNDRIQDIAAKKKELTVQAEEHANEIKKIHSVLEQGKQLKENLVNSKNHLNATNTPHEVMDKIEVLAERRQELYIWSFTNQGVDIPYTIHSIAKALKEDRNVYVECVIQDEKRHGKLSLQDGKIHLHKFLKQSVENKSIIMPYDRMQELVPPCPSLVFMDLSLGDTVVGRIIVKLDKNLPNLRTNMVDIVTGMKGCSLQGTKLKQDSPFLYANDLAFRDMPVIPDINATSKSKRGDVVGQYKSGYFQNIRFNVTAYEYPTDRVMGSIVSGLDFLQECYHNHKRGVVITDCGLVLQQEE